MDPDVRFAVAKRIVERAADHGIPREDIVVDPLLMPIGALAGAGRQVFRILGRLRDELKVNSTCGASNVSFGLPNREGINGAFLSMAIASGLTSAITNPVAEGVRHAVMASDVLMGNDQDARALDPPVPGRAGGRRGRRPAGQPPARTRGRRPAESRSAGCPRRRRPGARRPGRPLTRPMAARRAPRGPTATGAIPQIIFTPSGRRGRVPAGHDRARRRAVARRRHRLGLRRPRHLRPLRGHPGVRHRSPSTASRRSPDHLTRARRGRGGVPRGERPRRRPAAVLHRARRSATPSSTSRPRARSTARSCARTSPRGRSRWIRSCACTRSTSSEPDLATPTGDLGRLFDALAREWGLDDLRADLARRSAALQPTLTPGRLPGDGRGPRRPRRHRDLAGLPRPRVRRRHRRRLDHDRRAPRGPARRLGPRQRRA